MFGDCVTVAVKNKLIPFYKPDLGWEEEKAVLNVIRSGWLGYGKVSQEFSFEFGKALKTDHAVYCVAVNSCTMGLMLALREMNIGSGDEVITTPLTFAATANAILSVGARPVFVDVTKEGVIDPSKIETSITPETKAIIPVHLWGTPCDMDKIWSIARKHLLHVIEDAAHGFGGTYKGKSLGTLAPTGVFSFYPTKNITAGEGGMVVTQSQRSAECLLSMASQGMNTEAWNRYGVNGEPTTYQVITEGYKGLMPDMFAAIGLSQLKRWPVFENKRESIWRIYERAFGKKPEGTSRHIYEIRVKNRNKLRKELYEAGVSTAIHYTSLLDEPAFVEFQLSSYCPIASKIGSETLSLPLFTKMTEADAHFVVETVKKLKGKGND